MILQIVALTQLCAWLICPSLEAMKRHDPLCVRLKYKPFTPSELASMFSDFTDKGLTARWDCLSSKDTKSVK